MKWTKGTKETSAQEDGPAVAETPVKLFVQGFSPRMKGCCRPRYGHRCGRGHGHKHDGDGSCDGFGDGVLAWDIEATSGEQGNDRLRLTRLLRRDARKCVELVRALHLSRSST